MSTQLVAVVGGVAMVGGVVAVLLAVATPHHEHHSDHHQRAGQDGREQQRILEGTPGAEQDDQHERPDTEHPEQMVLPAVVVTLQIHVHVLGTSCCWSTPDPGVAARSDGKIWEIAQNPRAT